MISPAQCRAARAWLNLEQKDLAEIIRCSRDTLRRFEQTGSTLREPTPSYLRVVFEERGIVFTFTRDGEPLGIEIRTKQNVPNYR